jgi:hypothetical protein
VSRERQPRKRKPPDSAAIRPAERIAQPPGLDEHHRSREGEVYRKYGHTLIASLRQTYGASFAPAFLGHMFLGEVLKELDEPSLRQLIDDRRNSPQASGRRSQVTMGPSRGRRHRLAG